MKIRFAYGHRQKDFIDYITLEGENKEEIIGDFKNFLMDRGLDSEGCWGSIDEEFPT